MTAAGNKPDDGTGSVNIRHGLQRILKTEFIVLDFIRLAFLSVELAVNLVLAEGKPQQTGAGFSNIPSNACFWSWQPLRIFTGAAAWYNLFFFSFFLCFK